MVTVKTISLVTSTVYTRNPLVQLRHQRHHHKPDWPTKCSWQDHETTSCDVWSRKTTSRSHSGPHDTASGCHWSPPRQQAAVETSTWLASPSVDATTGSRHRTRRWCRMGHSQWSSSMEGTTTHRRSSGSMNEWSSVRQYTMHIRQLTSRCGQRARLALQTVDRWRQQRLLILVAEAQVVEVNVHSTISPGLWQWLKKNHHCIPFTTINSPHTLVAII